jgi:4-alpha-glucanotransferase
MERGAGVLLHVTSLPDGGFKSAPKFIDFLSQSGIKYWQVLAFGPTGMCDSPYAPLSVFAINPKFSRDFKTYDKVAVDKFIKQHKFWIESYAAFMSKRDGKSPEHHIQVQMNLFEQWAEVRKYANDRGVKIIGDIPIYPAMDSADVVSHKAQFQFNGSKPIAVAGVGPDYFNKDGQHWGNPLYDWDVMQKDKFKWWIARMKLMNELFDIVRIDHFRAFDSYYKIPYGAKSAKEGEWVKGPGLKFFTAIQKAIPDAQIILEDLGDITPSVRALRDKTGYPGMRIMQFGFDGDMDNEHLPINYPQNSVAYVGTHDNDTLMGFVQKLGKGQRAIIDQYLHTENLCDKDVARVALEHTLQSKSDMVIVAMQDFMFQGTKYRMNTPGTVGGNWGYKINAIDLTGELGYYIRLLLNQSNR